MPNTMTKMKFTTLLASLALAGMVFTTGCKKEGCTDPLALNYDEDAKKDDGSCEYENANATVYEDLGNGVTRVEDKGEGTGTMTWTKDKVWLLDGFVFVNSGQTLTIEAGTVIKGKEGQGSDASALIVARGGMIMANGTASEPIIMTYENDDVNSTTDVPAGTRGKWGGLLVLGKARTNTVPAEKSIEGIPTTEVRGMYGGTDDADNSGVIRYVSVRHGGTDIGAGNEINGVTFGAVGSSTVVEHVEVAFNADDAFEWFGGTVNCKWLVAAYTGDDCFDYDEGWRGLGQFWFAIQDAAEGDRGGEHDGGTDPETGTPYAHPIIYNVTYVGQGVAGGKRLLTLRDNAAGEYHNSIFAEWGKGVDVELLASGEDSYDRYQAGELKVENNIFWNVNNNIGTELITVTTGSGTSSLDSSNAAASLAAYFATAGNQVLDPGFTISYANDGLLDVTPSNSTVLSGATAPSGSFYSPVSYYGAFDGTTNWASGWTLMSAYGFIQ